MRSAVLVVLLLAPAAALARPTKLPEGTTFRPLCPDHSCKAMVATDAHGGVLHFSTPQGYEPHDLQTLFNSDPTLGAGVTVAIVDAYGYQELESDLAVYRSQFGLPPCSVASGCLTILNSSGQTTPLAPDTDQSWIGETALDVQMVSAACPMCNIVVIQAEAAGLEGFQVGQLVAATLDVDAISDSWGSPEDETDPDNEGDYDNAGIGTFVSSGDDGFSGGPSYPATSAFAISVGGVEYDSDTMTYQAWDDASSGCSAFIAKQSWSPIAAPCTTRASADVSGFAAPNPGVATYVAMQGGWIPVGGTSAAAPFTAATFAAAGHGDARPAFVYAHPEVYNDIVGGSSGSCGGVLCEGVVGWDGPTGLGTPDQAKLVTIGNVVGAGPAVMVAYPTDGATVAPGFTIEMATTDAAVWTQVQIDGVNFTRLGTAAMTTAPTTIADGAHTLTFTSYDGDHNSQTATVAVTVGSDNTGGGGGGGCAAGGGMPGVGSLLALLGLVWRRRR